MERGKATWGTLSPPRELCSGQTHSLPGSPGSRPRDERRVVGWTCKDVENQHKKKEESHKRGSVGGPVICKHRLQGTAQPMRAQEAGRVPMGPFLGRRGWCQLQEPGRTRGCSSTPPGGHQHPHLLDPKGPLYPSEDTFTFQDSELTF